jgi:hypothetical protein
MKKEHTESGEFASHVVLETGREVDGVSKGSLFGLGKINRGRSGCIEGHSTPRLVAGVK